MTPRNHPENNHSQHLSQAYQLFFDALQKDSLDALVEAGWIYFHNPVLLTDENYHLISQYPQEPIGQSVWDALYTDRTLPTTVIQAYQKEFLDEAGPFYKPFYADSGLASDCPRIFGEIYSQNRIFGHIAVFFRWESFQESDLKAVEILISAIKILLTPRKNRNGFSLSTYLRDLLLEGSSIQTAALAKSNLEKYIPGYYCVMATPIGNTASQRAFSAMVISQIPGIYHSSTSTIYGDCIVTLFGMLKGDLYTEKEQAFFQRVSDYLSPSDSPSGISQKFLNLLELRGRYMQAYTTALCTKKPYEFFDSQFPDQLFQLVSLHVPRNLFIHPALYQIQTYDREHDTNYFRTLEVYSLTLHNKEAASRQLCIHRNTLLYRLSRIEQLFDLAYEDPQVALSLLNSFQLWES